MVPAGFARRYAAWSLDAAAIAAIAIVLAWPLLRPASQAWSAASAHLAGTVAAALFDGLLSRKPLPAIAAGLLDTARLHAAVDAFRSATWQVAWPFLLGYGVVALPWHVLGVASRGQASPGKRAFSLHVTGPGGSRPTPARALARHLAAGLSWLTLNAGHLLALGPRAAALHDRIAGTRVARRPGGAARGFALAAWLVAQALAALLLLGWASQAVADQAANASASASTTVSGPHTSCQMKYRMPNITT